MMFVSSHEYLSDIGGNPPICLDSRAAVLSEVWVADERGIDAWTRLAAGESGA